MIAYSTKKMLKMAGRYFEIFPKQYEHTLLSANSCHAGGRQGRGLQSEGEEVAFHHRDSRRRHQNERRKQKGDELLHNCALCNLGIYLSSCVAHYICLLALLR
jgi:hypothetical protein